MVLAARGARVFGLRMLCGFEVAAKIQRPLGQHFAHHHGEQAFVGRKTRFEEVEKLVLAVERANTKDPFMA